MVCFWFGVVGGQCAQILGLLETFLRAVRGHIVELEFSTGKSSCMCGVATIFLHLAVLSRFQGGFRGKKGNCGPKLQILKCRSSTCDARSRRPQLKSLLILCVVYPSHPQVACTKILAESEAPRRSCDFSPFRAYLLLTCCLLLAACLLAKPVRSTLDTGERYQTKIGSTGSVTLTLTWGYSGVPGSSVTPSTS